MSLEAAFPVRGFAGWAVEQAAGAVADLSRRLGGSSAPVVDADLSLAWFAGSLTPMGWSIPPPWDPLAGDYPCSDGWIRLHTNAPHHRHAALASLGLPVDPVPNRATVAAAVVGWTGEALETAVVSAGGCAAQMRSEAEWADHPQGRAVEQEPLIAWTGHGTAAPLSPQAAPERPLAGVRVLDLTRIIAGPVATRFLAGLGAEVLRIDPPGWAEPAAEAELTVGKRCARLDLTSAAGARRIRDLVADADILVSGYRAGALAGLGLDSGRLQQLRPGLVEISLNAYGWSGPWAQRRGFDSLVQMSTGIAHTGMAHFAADSPRPLPVQALDHATGYLTAAAALQAWLRRLDGEVGSARLSLARTAAELRHLADRQVSDGTPGEMPDGGAPAGSGAAARTAESGPLQQLEEETFWGPALRLVPPVRFAGAGPQPHLSWDMPAGPLGSADPHWQRAGRNGL
ncbi:CoA transferase [Arthrobacter sp. zg-Y820]|uniref:CoA transferase n=1 Tax=unclassified Arthrobacter TaxID=235627 RepID=UPI001E636811|nr:MULTISPECIES: CoA transferase [unclassified Arthrobacter]MCC9196379.1 CoA transferase [Arthrobacter sp. zg-Y820]MDK1279241.1 CoA transferase [Arthrobacter sp. zg.Y820]WIB08362.1 CoA transferase [Arthrobacter sp. zg-Y820]